MIKLNEAGIRELLRTGGVAADIRRRAEEIASAARSGLEDPTGIEVIDAGDEKRARAVVITTSFEARKAEATKRTLTRAIDAGR